MRAFLLLVFVTIVGQAFAQDEEFFRKMLSGQLNVDGNFGEIPKYKYYVESPIYKIDFNDDGIFENFKVIKADGENWIELSSGKGIRLFKRKLMTLGRDSYLYRINVFRISKTTKAFVLSFYEGFSKYIDFEGTARIYLLTVDGKDLKTLSILMGPSFFVEREHRGNTYSRNFYELSAEDYNGDGDREIMVRYKQMARVYLYAGKGHWRNF